MNIGTLWAHIGLDTTGLQTGVKESEAALGGLNSSVSSVITNLGGFALAAGAIYAVKQQFMDGITAVDSFRMSVIKSASMMASLKASGDMASNYAAAKKEAEGLQNVLMRVDADTSLNLENLQVINEELIKQRVQFDYNNKAQVEGFTRLANAAAMYSRNGADERQLRQEVAALVRGEVNINSQLSSIMQGMVKGPMTEMVSQWKASDTFLQNVGANLRGFGEGSKDISKTWSAVTSSFQTTKSLLQREVFAKPFEDLVYALDSANNYLKTHRSEIAENLIPTYGALKGAMKIGIDSLIKGSDDLLFIAKVTAMALAGWALSAAIAGASAAWGAFMVLVNASLASNPVGWGIALGIAAIYTATKIWDLVQAYKSLYEQQQRMEREKTKLAPSHGLGAIPFLQPLSSHGADQERFKIDAKKQMDEWEREKKGLEASLSATQAYNNQALSLLKAQNEARKMVLEKQWIGEEEQARKHFANLMNLDLAEKDKQIANARQKSSDLEKILVATAGAKGGTKTSPEYLKEAGELRANNMQIDVLLQERKNIIAKSGNDLTAYLVEQATTRQKDAQNMLGNYEKQNQDLLQLISTRESALAQVRDTYKGDLDKALLFQGNARGEEEQNIADNLVASIVAMINAKTEFTNKSWGFTDLANQMSTIDNQIALLDQAESDYSLTTVEATRKRIVLLDTQKLSAIEARNGIEQNGEDEKAQWQSQQNAINALNIKLIEQQKILNDRTAIGGARNAFREYADSATNSGMQIKNAILNSFKTMEDAIVTFVMTGKASFKDFTNAIIADMVRIMVQRQITGILASGVSAMIGPATSSYNLNTGSRYAPSAPSYSMMPKLATGTDYIPQDGPYYLHQGEGVTPTKFTGKGTDLKLEIINQSGTPVKARESGIRFDGTQMIKTVILESLDTDPTFRNAVRG
jgi:hypothetical protein